MEQNVKNCLSFKYVVLILMIFPSIGFAQGWKPANDDLHSIQPGGGFPVGFELKFKTNLGGKEWIYGGYWDTDSLRRNVAYREGGKWVPLPFSGYFGNIASDIEMYGDTLYILGSFLNLVQDDSGDTLADTGLIKWFNDSLWTVNDKQGASKLLISAFHMSAKGDSMIIAGGSYYDTVKLIGDQFMSSNGGQSWQYPYSVIHPTETVGYFGATYYKVEILPNGDILTINNGSPLGSTFRGLSRWDGQQWHGFGNGLSGSTSRAFDFEFYKGQLYMGGTFSKSVFPNDPGDFIARWNGLQWEEFANGVEGFVHDMFAYDNILYTSIDGGQISDHRFGDVKIPFFAGWDGHQWCGTPSQFKRPPAHFGFINDTLYVSFLEPSVIDGDSVGYMAYYDGDYLHGPNAICSTFGLGQDEMTNYKASSFTVHPNPAQDKIQIRGIKGLNIKSVKVWSPNGKCLLNRKFESETLNVDLDLLRFSPGLLLLEVNGMVFQKIVKK